MHFTDDYETSKGLRRTLESVAHRAGRVYRVRGGGVIIATSHDRAEAIDFAYGVDQAIEEARDWSVG